MKFAGELMLFMIGSLFDLRIGATLTNKSFSTKNSLLQKKLRKMGGPKGKKDRNSLNSSHQKDSMQTSSKNHDRLEQLQADHELFLQAFESKFCLFLNSFLN